MLPYGLGFYDRLSLRTVGDVGHQSERCMELPKVHGLTRSVYFLTFPLKYVLKLQKTPRECDRLCALGVLL